MKKNRLRLILSIIMILPIAVWTLMPSHIRNAILHLNPDIDDYTFFENRTIEASSSPIKWSTTADYNRQTLQPQWRDSLEHYETVAFLVIQNDSVLFEEYWDGYSTESLSNSFSMAKSVVGLLVGCAIEEGVIESVDQRVGDFLPQFQSGLGSTLTIKHLLTMSSASSWDESYSSISSITTKAYYGRNLRKLMESVTIDETPGNTFEYESGNTQLLAMILAQATGKNISQYASEKLWIPLGAEHDALWSLDRTDGVEKAYCCFNSNARDFARLGSIVLHKGKMNGHQIVSADYVEESIRPASWLKDSNNKPVDYYGYHWWILNYKGLQMPVARGILGQYVVVIPQHNAIVVRLGHKRSEAKRNNFTTDIYSYIDAAIEILTTQ